MYTMGNSARYLGSNSGRGLSPNVWAKFMKDLDSGNRGFFHLEQFKAFPKHDSTASGTFTGRLGNFSAFMAQGATIVPADVAGGALICSSDGDNEEIVLAPGAAPILLSSASPLAVFEARLKTSTITDTKHGFFCGLIESHLAATGTIIATAGTLADKNFIGWHRLEGDGDKLDVVYKADGQTQQSLITDAHTLVADTFVKVGMVFDPNAKPANRIAFYFDGVRQSTFVTQALMDAATFPDDIALGMAFALMNATASTPGSTTLDWMAMGQLYSNYP